MGKMGSGALVGGAGLAKPGRSCRPYLGWLAGAEAVWVTFLRSEAWTAHAMGGYGHLHLQLSLRKV